MICVSTGKCCDFTFRTPNGKDVKFRVRHTNQVTITCLACTTDYSFGLCNCNEIRDQNSWNQCCKDHKILVKEMFSSHFILVGKSDTCKIPNNGGNGWKCNPYNIWRSECIPMDDQCDRKCWQEIPTCGNKCCPQNVQGCNGNF